MLDNEASIDCELIRDQVDAYLDNDLDLPEQRNFLHHLQDCSGCEQEYQLARQLLRSVHDLPALDCPEELLEPINRLTSAIQEPAQRKLSAWELFSNWIGELTAIPTGVKYATSLAVVMVCVTVIFNSIYQPQNQIMAGADETVSIETPQYSEEELRTAAQELDIALGLLKEFSVLTRTLVEDRYLRQELGQSVYASFKNKTRNVKSGPI